MKMALLFECTEVGIQLPYRGYVGAFTNPLKDFCCYEAKKSLNGIHYCNTLKGKGYLLHKSGMNP